MNWCRVLAVSPALRHSEGASNRPSEQPGEADTELGRALSAEFLKTQLGKNTGERHFGSDHLPVVLEATGHPAMGAAHLAVTAGWSGDEFCLRGSMNSLELLRYDVLFIGIRYKSASSVSRFIAQGAAIL